MMPIDHIVVARNNDGHIQLLESAILNKPVDAWATNLLLRRPQLPRLPLGLEALDLIDLLHKLRELFDLGRAAELRHILPRNTEISLADSIFTDT